MNNIRMGTVREFDYEEPITHDPLPEVTGKICFVETEGEEFLEIKTLGPVDEVYHSDYLQVLRISKLAFEQLRVHWESFSTNAQTH